MDLRPDARLHLHQRGLSQLSASRLERRPGAASLYPAPVLDALAQRIATIEPAGVAALIAIDGWGCGGKTALAEGLLDRLEPAVHYLSTDEFFTGFDASDPGPVRHLRWSEFRAALQGLRARGAAGVRSYDWERSKVLDPTRLAGKAFLVEGLFSLRPELRAHYDLAIWVQGSLGDRMDRVAARDGAHMIPFWERDWMPRERAYIDAERPWETADLIVAGAGLEVGHLGASLRGGVSARPAGD